jgi:hypothetical protein
MVRQQCERIFDQLVDEESLPELVLSLDDEDPGVCARALHALACDRCKQNECRPSEDLWVPTDRVARLAEVLLLGTAIAGAAWLVLTLGENLDVLLRITATGEVKYVARPAKRLAKRGHRPESTGEHTFGGVTMIERERAGRRHLFPQHHGRGNRCRNPTPIPSADVPRQ